jgi:hypothetical protein
MSIPFMTLAKPGECPKSHDPNTTSSDAATDIFSLQGKSAIGKEHQKTRFLLNSAHVHPVSKQSDNDEALTPHQ